MVFEKSQERIDSILNVCYLSVCCLRHELTLSLQKHPGYIHFATDAWTSPNHRAFVAWTVHLHHEGHILMFLLDIVEVPEVCDVLHLGMTPLIVAS
jgi:hypothetical protein